MIIRVGSTPATLADVRCTPPPSPFWRVQATADGGQASIGSALIHAPNSPGLLAIGSSELAAFRIRVMS
jgi:hypothetical protein